jgi:hypothetical protein
VRVLRSADLLAEVGEDPKRVYVVPNKLQWMWPSNEVGSKVTVPDVTTSTGEKVVLTTAVRQAIFFLVRK